MAALQSTLYQQNPALQVVGKSGDIARYLRLSGTSMATAVTTGVVAMMLDAAGSNKKSFTPNLVKGMLRWTAIGIPGYDTLTQGSGAVNLPGALYLTGKINPTAPVGTYWLTSAITPSTIIASASWPWEQTGVLGNKVVWGYDEASNTCAWWLQYVCGR